MYPTIHIAIIADKINRDTQKTLLEVKSDTKAIAQVALPELEKYGDSMRKFILAKESSSDDTEPSVMESIENILTTFKSDIRQINFENGDLDTIKNQLDELTKKQ